ncbi:MAG: exodeoxyribonuclease VII small subunit [Actinobacteria bacterium]|nr:exodeoxyribonuclease VII small subunit [Actinomycetota bacterium]
MGDIKFEEALSRLETIVNDLEKGGLTLEDSLKKFEEGIKLSDYCVKKLEEVEKKIEVLSNGEITPVEQGEEPPAS